MQNFPPSSLVYLMFSNGSFGRTTDIFEEVHIALRVSAWELSFEIKR